MKELIKNWIRRFFSYLGEKIKGFAARRKEATLRRVGKWSSWLNRQNWIKDIFACVGGGTVLFFAGLALWNTPWEQGYQDVMIKAHFLEEYRVPVAEASTMKDKQVRVSNDDKSTKAGKSAEEMNPEEVETLIRKVAKEENFADADLLVRIAKAESGLKPTNSNSRGNKPESTDRGLFMINDYWQKQVTDEEAYDPTFATKWAIEKINAGGISIWNPSRPNWDK